MNRIELIPNIFTAANLLLGVAALASTLNQRYDISVILILLAALADRFDGMLARHYHVVSEFGKQLDSLADIVSFGIAPAALMYNTVVGEWPLAGLFCFCLYTLCGGLRLARYNLSPSSSFFQGVPITVCGAILALLVLFVPNTMVLLGTSILLALAMISKIRIPKI